MTASIWITHSHLYMKSYCNYYNNLIFLIPNEWGRYKKIVGNHVHQELWFLLHMQTEQHIMSLICDHSLLLMLMGLDEIKALLCLRSFHASLIGRYWTFLIFALFSRRKVRFILKNREYFVYFSAFFTKHDRKFCRLLSYNKVSNLLLILERHGSWNALSTNRIIVSCLIVCFRILSAVCSNKYEIFSE